MKARFYSTIHDIDATAWDDLWRSDYPFTRHGFLAALEDSGSIGGTTKHETGWHPSYAILEDETGLVAAMPLFLKSHSYGEYVFDWSWASAYQRAGLDYYPKLLAAIPFTPATGPRIGFASCLDEPQRQAALTILLEEINSFGEDHRSSGLHILFPSAKEATLLQAHGHRRCGYQFHWFNQNFRDFEHFLENFASRKRKNVRRERAKVAEHQLTITMRDGRDVSAAQWDQFYALYHRTYLKRSGHAGYLGPQFFHQLANTMPQQVLLASAHQGEHMIAGAFYLRDSATLYGRYWGTQVDLDGLHFECCYYQGIEYAIREGLRRFDPGAQGEHKIQRGFTPIRTQSFHALSHPAFDRAIANALAEEAPQVEAYIKETRRLMPFKEGVPIVDVGELSD